MERIVSSEVFARSSRARDLLRYLVEQDLAGNSERLKGFSIGIDVFGKDDRFDPATDTVVRVQAGRLRDMLDQYYAGPGADDPLRIAVPRGNYVPDYRIATEAVVAQQAQPAMASAAMAQPPSATRGHAERRPQGVAKDAGAAAPSRAEAAPSRIETPAPQPVAAMGPDTHPSRALTLAGFCLVAVLLAVLSYRSVAPPAADLADLAVGTVQVRAPQPNDAAIVSHHLLPSIYIEVEPGDDDRERLATMLRRGLAGFDTLTFTTRPDAAEQPDGRRHMQFAFVLEDGQAPGEVHAELHYRANGRVLLSQNIAMAGRSQSEIEDAVADLLTSIAPVSGVIYASLAEDGVETTLTRCLSLNDDYYRGQTVERHRAAYECLEQLMASGVRSPLVYSELSSLQVQAQTNSYDYPEGVSPREALRLAQEGVRLGPSSPYAHRALGYVMSRTGDTRESIRWTRKAYELNTFDLGMAAAYGYALIFAGDYAEGTPVLRRAVTAASSHAMWWDYGLFLGEFMLDDMHAAAQSVSALGSSRRAHYIAARLITAHGLGRTAEATQLLAELREGYSVFAADPKAFFERGKYPPEMIDRLVAALRAAGLIGAS